MSFPTGLTVDRTVDVLQDDAPPPLTDLDKSVRSECRTSLCVYDASNLAND